MLLGSRPAFLMKFAQIDAILHRAIEQNLHPALKKTALRSLTEILKVASWKGIWLYIDLLSADGTEQDL